MALRLKEPQFELLRGIDNAVGAVVPKKYIEGKGVDYFRKNPIGSGPFKVVTFIPGTRLELEALDSHWRTVPKFKNLTVVSLREESTKVAMLKTGEVDLAEVAPDSVPGLKSAGLRILSYDGGAQFYGFLFYDMEHPERYAFGDVRVRKALQLGIDSKEIAAKMLGGYGGPYYLFGVDEFGYYADSNVLKPDPYDPEGAKKLLAEAGYANGFNTKIWDNGGGGILSTFNQALAGYWRKVGINTAVEPIDRSPIISMIRTYSDQRVWNTVFTAGIGTASAPASVGFDIMAAFHSTLGFYRNHTNKRLNELIDLYPMTKDSAERLKVAREATVSAKNEYSVISVLDVQAIWGLGAKIGDLRPIQGQPMIGAAYATVTHAK